MKQERKEELMVRWMDDELSAQELGELEPYLDADPELRVMQNGHREMQGRLRKAFQEGDVPYGDFFQTKLQRAVEFERHDSAIAKKKSSWRDALRWSLAPVSVGALALAFLAGTKVTHEPAGSARVVAVTVDSVVYTPEGGVSANFFQQRESGTSVIMLEGLQPLPDDFDLMADAMGSQSTPGDIQLVSTSRERAFY